MADKSFSRGGAVQDTGNPVFDATVNILMNAHTHWTVDNITELHQAVVTIYQREPGVDHLGSLADKPPKRP